MSESYIIILEIPCDKYESSIEDFKIVYVSKNKWKAEETLNILQNSDVNPNKSVIYELFYLSDYKKNKRFELLNRNEEEIIDIYRHLDGQNKTLIRRSIKNLDTYYSADTQSKYFWSNDTPSKTTLYTIEESDLLNSFRALNYKQQKEFLKNLHNQLIQKEASNFELTIEEQKLIEDFRRLNCYECELIRKSINAMLHNEVLPAEAESEPKKK